MEASSRRKGGGEGGGGVGDGEGRGRAGGGERVVVERTGERRVGMKKRNQKKYRIK